MRGGIASRVVLAGAVVMILGILIATVVVLGFPASIGRRQSTSNSGSPWPDATSTVSADGLQLNVSANATEIQAGQAINVSLRLSNTRAGVLSLRNASDWAFRGIPIAVWEPCDVILPLEFLVLKGNYTVDQIIAGGNNPTLSYTCLEATSINHVEFMPNSDLANVTGVYSQGGGNNTFGPYVMGTNFSIRGYWDQITPQEASPTFYSPTFDGFSYPGIPPSPQHLFAPGIYTPAVADEWGGFGVLHFEVS